MREYIPVTLSKPCPPSKRVNILNPRIRTVAAACAAVAIVLNLGSPAFASQLSDKRAQAVAVQQQVSALNDKAELATEQYDAARARYQAVSAKVSAIRTRIAQLKGKISTLQTALGNQADEMYREGGTIGIIEALLSTRTIEDFNSTLELITRIGDQNAATVDKLKGLQAQATAQKTQLVAAQADAGRQQAAMAANAKTVRARLADSKRLLASVQSDIRAIIAAQQRAEAAAAAARAAALARRSGGSFDPGGNPPTSSKGAAAVWWAEKALGRPYRWGAAGPGSFDCSGLMVWSYGHVGIRLPHFSGAQINVGSRVSRSNLEPGDLVFFGHPIHHVGMYVGGGDFIEAPHTGANVRVSSLGGRWDYAGACRP